MADQKAVSEAIFAWFEAKARAYGQTERDHTLLGVQIFRLGKELSTAIAHVVKSFGLTGAEYRTLLMLRPSYGEPALTPGDLMLLTYTTSGGMAKILKSLESRDMIERRPNPGDARSHLIGLTQKGLDLIDRIFPESWKASQAIFSKTLTPEEADELGRLLSRVLERGGADQKAPSAARRTG